jgi:hypothetical protein
MTYNVVDELTKLQITFPFMEVVKIPQQRENILNILDDTSSSSLRIEATCYEHKETTKYYTSKAKRKGSTILHIIGES